MNYERLVPATIALVALAACSSDRMTAPSPSISPSADVSLSREQSNGGDREGIVFTLSNLSTGNSVLAFRRHADGSLTATGSYPTGGNGSGAGTGSQNAVVFSPDGTLLFAVNPGSNSVTSFRVQDDKLTFASRIESHGSHPISVTASNGLLYVLNDGGSGNISGLRYASDGKLSSIPGSSRALSSTNSAPAEVQFTKGGDRLIVSEKNTNVIAAYTVASNGVASNGLFTPSSGMTPFGFAIRNEDIIVSEAFGGAANASKASSYKVGHVGAPSVISASVPTTESSACWVVVTTDGKYAYTANTGSGTLSGFAVAKNGSLTLLQANGESAVFGAGTAPADLAVSHNGEFIYSRNGGARTIGVASIHADGSLTVLGGGVAGLPASAVGLAAR